MINVHPFKMFTLACLIILFSTVSAIAGQLVTPDNQQWATQAVQQEKQLAAMTKPNSIAVLYFRNLSEDRSLDPLQKGLTVMLISDLAKLDMVTVVERAELQALVEELGFGQSGLVDPSSAPRVGRLLQSQYLIGGSFSGTSATEVTVGAKLVDVAPGKSIGSAEAKDKMEQIFNLEKKLLNQIITELKLNLTQQQKRSLDKPLSRNSEALMDLFRGIDAADQKRFEAATDHLGSAIQRDPDLKIAKTLLQELKSQGLVTPGRAIGGKQASKTASEKEQELAHQRRLLRSMRNNTSFSTTLEPATPVARIPHPAAVQPVTQPPVGQPTDIFR